MNKAHLEKNITKIYYLKFFLMFLVLMPVIVPYFNSLGIGMKGVYLLMSIFSITIFIFEVPSGYISDLLGRKNTLIAASALRGIGFSLFPLAHNLTILIIAEIILGIAVSLSSGTDTALIYDTLESTGSKKAQIKILGKSLSYLSLGEGLAALIASACMYFGASIYNLAVISAIISWVTFFIALTIVEPPRAKMGNKHKENFSYIFSELFKKTRLLKLILANMVFSFSSTLMAVWLFQKYWKDLGVPLVYFGILWALSNFSVSIASVKAHKIEKKMGSANMLILVGLLPIVGFFGISFTEHLYGVLFCFLFNICRGLGQVVYKDALNRRVSADFRASANSISQMGTRIFFTIAGPILGYAIDQYGLRSSTNVMGYFYIAIFFFVLIPLLKERKNFINIK